MSRKERVEKMIQELDRLFPEASTALQFANTWELLVAVILSAQCTDKKVNEVTGRLFAKYPKLKDYLEADYEEFAQDIRQTGFYKNKAKNVLAAARMVKEQFNGEVPRTMEEMLQIPGVARKTANVVLGSAYGVVEGVPVDTHVKRLSFKLGLTKEKSPEKIEQDLMKLLPKDRWFTFPNQLILYGREICSARRHECKEHPLTLLYPKAASIWPTAS